jgi:hypothetical protein
MHFANRGDIESWRALTRGRGDNLESAVLILEGVADDADQLSDGWHSWPAPCRAARQLILLIETHLPSVPVHASDLRKALAPVRAFYTRQHAKYSAWPATPPHCEERQDA